MSSMMLGVLGPSSGAEPAQKIVHKITGSDEPLGWEYQVDDEPVFALQRSRLWREEIKQFGRYDTDLLTGLQGEIGTLSVALNAAAILRWGIALDQSHSTFSLVATRESNPMASLAASIYMRVEAMVTRSMISIGMVAYFRTRPNMNQRTR